MPLLAYRHIIPPGASWQTLFGNRVKAISAVVFERLDAFRSTTASNRRALNVILSETDLKWTETFVNRRFRPHYYYVLLQT